MRCHTCLGPSVDPRLQDHNARQNVQLLLFFLLLSDNCSNRTPDVCGHSIEMTEKPGQICAVQMDVISALVSH